MIVIEDIMTQEPQCFMGISRAITLLENADFDVDWSNDQLLVKGSLGAPSGSIPITSEGSVDYDEVFAFINSAK